VMPRGTDGTGPRDPVFVAGAPGFLGQAIVGALAARGDPVRGLVHDPAKASRVRKAGGTPVEGDVRDLDSLVRATRGCRAIVHVAASGSREESDLDDLRRVRVDGVRNLIEAARRNRVPRVVVGSGYWVYGSRPTPITEDSPVDPQGEALVNYEAERAGLEANAPGELDVMVIRPGMVYGDGAWFRPVVDAIEAGRYRIIDGGGNSWSFVALPDAGAGFLAVVDHGRPGEVYNLVDGDPRPWGEFARFVTDRLGRPNPLPLSLDAAIEEYGPVIARHLAANRAVRAEKLRSIGWSPRFPSYPEGVESVLREMGRLKGPQRGSGPDRLGRAGVRGP
jgi:nucleoside-diphosphate-sugar epimerase